MYIKFLLQKTIISYIYLLYINKIYLARGSERVILEINIHKKHAQNKILMGNCAERTHVDVQEKMFFVISFLVD